MRVIFQQPDESLPEYSGVAYNNPAEAEDVVVRSQGDEFIAIIQWDGAGETQHWVLVHRDNLEDFITALRRAAE